MDAQVIVAGAGPAGMMLAGELRLAGADVIVLEKLAARTGESRGLGFTARTMEIFDQRGLLSRFGDIEVSNVGHFGGLPVDFGVLKGAHQAAKTIPQSATETVLEEWATQLGADIRRSHELLSVTDKEDCVEVEVRGPGAFTPCAPTTWSAVTAAAPPCARPPASNSPAPRRPWRCFWPTSRASPSHRA